MMIDDDYLDSRSSSSFFTCPERISIFKESQTVLPFIRQVRA
jgi:hypothetical protein